MERFYKNKRILILGGSGFIGSHLAEKVVELGCEVTVADIKKPRNNKIEYEKVSIIEPSQVQKVIKKKFPIIFNLAGVSGVVNQDVEMSFRVNCLGGLNILEAVRRYSPESKVIMSNSRQEYGKPKYLPVDEKHPTYPINFYGIQKLALTNLAMNYHMVYKVKAVVLRTSNVYGWYGLEGKQDYNVVSQWISQADKKKTIVVFGMGKQIRDYLYIDDFLEALLRAGRYQSAVGEIINIGSAKGLSMKQMAQIITKTLGGRIVYRKWPTKWLKAETGDYVSDISKAKRLLKWQAKTSFEAGVEKIAGEY